MRLTAFAILTLPLTITRSRKFPPFAITTYFAKTAQCQRDGWVHPQKLLKLFMPCMTRHPATQSGRAQTRTVHLMFLKK